jgi:hypothetical protein
VCPVMRRFDAVETFDFVEVYSSVTFGASDW